jgi:hypothetical protein
MTLFSKLSKLTILEDNLNIDRKPSKHLQHEYGILVDAFTVETNAALFQKMPAVPAYLAFFIMAIKMTI